MEKEKIDVNRTSLEELMVLMTCKLLLLTKHSRQFVQQQRFQIQKMIMDETVKQACLNALDAIEIEEGDYK